MKISIVLLHLLIASSMSYGQGSIKNDEPAAVGAYGKNILSLSPVAVNIHGWCYGLSYERFFTENNKVSLYIPLTFVHKSPTYYENYKYGVNSYSVNIGFKYYTAGSEGPVRYAIGGLIGIINDARHYTESQSLGGGTSSSDYTKVVTSAGMMVHNSLNVCFLKHFTYTLELNAGFGSGYFNFDESSEFTPMVLGSMSLGYRF